MIPGNNKKEMRMSLRDKQRAKKRKKREFKKQNPEHAVHAAQGQWLSESLDKLQDLELKSSFGRRLIRNQQFRERMSLLHGDEAVQEAIALYQHPEAIAELCREIKRLEQGLEHEPTEGHAAPLVDELVPKPSKNCIAQRRYRLSIDFTLSVNALEAQTVFAVDDDGEAFLLDKLEKLHAAILSDPVAMERLLRYHIASELEEYPALFLDLLHPPEEFEAIQSAVDSLPKEDAEWFHDVDKEGVLFENVGDVWDCFEIDADSLKLSVEPLLIGSDTNESQSRE